MSESRSEKMRYNAGEYDVVVVPFACCAASVVASAAFLLDFDVAHPPNIQMDANTAVAINIFFFIIKISSLLFHSAFSNCHTYFITVPLIIQSYHSFHKIYIYFFFLSILWLWANYFFEIPFYRLSSCFLFWKTISTDCQVIL